MADEQELNPKGWLTLPQRIMCWIASLQNESYLYFLGSIIEMFILIVSIIPIFNWLNSILPESSEFDATSYAIMSAFFVVLIQALLIIAYRSGNNYIIYSLNKIIIDNSAEKIDLFDLHIEAVRRRLRILSSGYHEELFCLKTGTNETSLDDVFKLIRFKIVADSILLSGTESTPFQNYATNCYNNLFKNKPSFEKIVEYYWHLFSNIDLKYRDALIDESDIESPRFWGITGKDIMMMIIESIVAIIIGGIVWSLTGFS